MRAFSFIKELIVKSPQIFRRYPLINEQATTADASACILQMPREDGLLIKESEKMYGPNQIRIIQEEGIAAWEKAPVRFGRLSSKFVGQGLHKHEEGTILPEQLKFIKERNPNKKHFRFALVNGYGVGFGDNFMGSSAFRLAAECMAKTFESFSVDLLMGVCHNFQIKGLMQHDPWIEKVRYKSISLAEFAQYDGYVDTSELPNLPRFNNMPFVDWYIWWYGLDPDSIPAEKKRNKVWITRQTWNDVYTQLRNIKGKKILYAPYASTALRTIPKNTSKRLITKILKEKEKYTVLTTSNVDIHHERLINLEGKTGDTEHFVALVSQCDFCISADSFAPHICDAASIPCVTLSGAMPGRFFPYYPYGSTIEIPDIDKLPGYRKCFVSSEEWAKMQEEYENAWNKIDHKIILNTLQTLDKKDKDGHPGLHVVNPYQSPTIITEKNGFDLFKRERISEEIAHASKTIISLIPSIVPTGGVCFITGCSIPEIIIKISQHLQSFDGNLIVFEPRKLYLQLCCGSLLRKNCTNVTFMNNMPLFEKKVWSFQDLDPWSEHWSHEWGNKITTTSSTTIAIDDINTDICHAIILQPPFSLLDTLKSALNKINKFHPAIVIIPNTEADIPTFAEFLRPLNYNMSVSKFENKNICLLATYTTKQ